MRADDVAVPVVVTVPTRGPRTIGSSAPQTTGTGFVPCSLSGWEVSTIVFGCFFFGRRVVMTSSSHRAEGPSGW